MVVDRFDTLKQRLRERREEAGLTQSEAAAVVGHGQQYISSLERGQNQPGVLMLVADLARAYGTTVDYLLGIVDDPSPSAGALLPEHALEVLESMRQLDNAQNYELLVIVRALLKEKESVRRLSVLDFIEAAADHFGAGEELDRIQELLTSLELGRSGRSGRLLSTADDTQQPTQHQP